MLTAHKQSLITYKAQLRYQKMMERWTKEYYGSRLEVQNGLHGQEGRHMAINSEGVEPGLSNPDLSQPNDQGVDAGYIDQDAINPNSLV